MDLEELAIAQERLHELGVPRIDPKDSVKGSDVRVHRSGRLSGAGIVNIDHKSWIKKRHQYLESVDRDLENGVINEGRYLEIVNRLSHDPFLSTMRS